MPPRPQSGPSRTPRGGEPCSHILASKLPSLADMPPARRGREPLLVHHYLLRCYQGCKARHLNPYTPYRIKRWRHFSPLYATSG